MTNTTRPIKFRAWKPKYNGGDGAFAYFNLLGDFEDHDYYELGTENVEQYTGLKDKNGKGQEVYKDDLVRALPDGNEPRVIYKVVWDERTMMWSLGDEFGGNSPLWLFTKDFEIIGNIHSNPELLQK